MGGSAVRRSINMDKNLQPSIEDFREDLQRLTQRNRELERELADALAGKFPEEKRLEPDLIEVSSVLSSRSYEPIVMIRWFTHTAQLSIAQARELAFNLLDCAEAAQSDAFLASFARERIGIEDLEDIGKLIVAFRDHRAKVLADGAATLDIECPTCERLIGSASIETGVCAHCGTLLKEADDERE